MWFCRVWPSTKRSVMTEAFGLQARMPSENRRGHQPGQRGRHRDSPKTQETAMHIHPRVSELIPTALLDLKPLE